MTKQCSEDIISVIVPVYNVENYISQCIESIINQSYINLQIILVDDGSTDSSGEICDKYMQNDSRIQVIHKKNEGLTTSRRAGMRIATGKYIGFVDADDYIDIDMYFMLYTVAERYQAQFVHSGYFEGSKDKIQCTSPKTVHYKNIQKKEWLLAELFSLYPDAEIGPALWCNLFERNFIINNYMQVPHSQSYGEDLITMCSCIIDADNFVSIPDCFYHYRVRGDSISNSVSEKRVLEYYVLYDLLRKILEKNICTESSITALKRRFHILMLQFLAKQNNYYIPKYKYSKIEELKNKKIILYGCGKVGQDYYHQICKYQYCAIVSWVDQKETHFDYATIENEDILKEKEYDIILIAVYDESTANAIKKQLISYGINEKKIIWKKAVLILD